MVHAIIAAKLNPNLPARIGITRRNALNRERCTNALPPKKVVGPLANRGKSLSKDELTAGKKTDEDLHRLICLSFVSFDGIIFFGAGTHGEK